MVFVGTGVGILYLVYQNQNASYMEECGLRGIPDAECSLLQKVINDFKGVNYWWILVVLVCFIVSNISRALRWNMLLRPLVNHRPRFINAFFAVILAYFGNLGFPRLGEVIRMGTMSRYEKIPLEKVAGTWVLDRLLDVVSILIVTALAIFLEYDRVWGYLSENFALDDKIAQLLSSTVFWIVIGFGVAVLVGLVVLRKKIMATAFYAKIMEKLIGFWDGLKTISQLDNLSVFLFHSVNIWLMYFLMTYVCFFAFAPTAHLSPAAGLLIFVLGGWGIVIPSPGGMGTYHALVIAGLALYGINGDDAFSYANINFFSIQVGINVVIGLLALLLLPIINKNYNPNPESKTLEHANTYHR